MAVMANERKYTVRVTVPGQIPVVIFEDRNLTREEAARGLGYGMLVWDELDAGKVDNIIKRREVVPGFSVECKWSITPDVPPKRREPSILEGGIGSVD